MIIQAPKGTKDVLPSESYKWIHIEETIRNLTKAFGYKEIRTPTFEYTELFERGVGDTTDIVQKEMYTFLDKGNRSITLKPEGTAGAVRAYIENKLYAEPQPVKIYYFTPVFRYEKPQAGRLREHHQFGVEVFGAQDASIDAEIIYLAMTLLNRLGIYDLELNINSIGCPNCRPKYQEVLKKFLGHSLGSLCKTCNERFERNPLRILDCKIEDCGQVIKEAPVILDFLCDGCSQHFQNLQYYLKETKLDFSINPMIVRGLDYYTKTVFEIISKNIGSQGTVCGGGRYDGLVDQCGGPSTPGIGFGMGLERLLLNLEAEGIDIKMPKQYDVFFVTIGVEARGKAYRLVNDLRLNGFSVDMDHVGRSIKAQFKYADKLSAPWVCIIGQDEIETGKVKVKEMMTGNETMVNDNELTSFLINNRIREV
jgi:histidyl-tRNA synthetase